ncbi:STAS domain-containing protein [Clostridiaceae bacterium 35-E11]
MSLDIHTDYNHEKHMWMMDLTGEIDIYTANTLKESLTKILDERNENIRINCLELQYIDSTGLGVLIGILKKLKKNDKNIIIANPRSNISKLLQITGLNKIFIIEGE